MGALNKVKKIIKNSNSLEKFKAKNGIGFKLAKTVKPNFKIGMAVLAYERPEYLEICLDSLFKSELYNYDITFLLQDDGSKDPKVAELINKTRDSKYKIIRYLTPKGGNSAGAAINKAVKKLMEMDDFDIIGWADGDALFHPEWLKHTMEICLWAKENHKEHILGPFTSFNSSDFIFHQVLGTYSSPFGNYVVKRQAGMLNYFYFKEDFIKLGFFEENRDDETLMTQTFERLKVRNFCTETSWVEHLGQISILNQWRPSVVINAVHAIMPAPGKWGDYDLKDFRKQPDEYYANIEREYSMNNFNISNNDRVGVLERINRINRNIINKFYLRIQSISAYNRLIKWWNGNLSNLQRVYKVETRIGLNSAVVPSSLELEVVIPAIPRDADVLKNVIDSVHQYIKHPIKKIHIISPESEDLRNLCKEKNCEFVLENEVLPIKLADVNYIANGKDRSGWLFQQLLKWGAEKLVSTENYLVLDADTVFIRDHVFEENGKFILELADESHSPYFTTYSKLTGEPAYSPFSFVSHHMLINKKHLDELKELIKKETSEEWYKAIINKADRENIASSGFSEYETYGNFMFAHYRDNIKLEYWYNLSLKRAEMANLSGLVNRFKNKYKTISFQYYK